MLFILKIECPQSHKSLEVIEALWFLTGTLRKQLHCWRAARFAKQIELPPDLRVHYGNS
jgi:hypothetical protein